MDEYELSPREERILATVIRNFVETAEPTASRTVARKNDMGLSPATIRNTMSDLTQRGYLTQPHPSAGRIPTDKAYRYYVRSLMQIERVSPEEVRRLEESVGGTGPGDEILRRAIQALSVVTSELGIGLGPSPATGVLERIEIVALSSERILIVIAIASGPVRTIFVETPVEIAESELGAVASLLNERLAGLSLREVRETYRVRLGDPPAEHAELLNIFLEQADTAFAPPPAGDDIILGPASSLAAQPEFSNRENLRNLLELTERRDLLAEALYLRRARGMVISIGDEHSQPPLLDFSLVTTHYEVGAVRGTIGVIGPTRMPYERVVALVQYTARLLSAVSRPPS
ncbi:MAG: heat-inducible transcriptional repressor HrcA [Gemmatimonadota bacterium]